jgi:N-acetylglucosaminyldiphosphoundecaprenol N-acetyl-beta-D-mannosaminyltransferase
MRKLLIILGVPVDDLNMSEALERLEEFIRIGRATGKSHQIATVNADFVVNSLHDPELRRILQESDMATADGMPLVMGARMLGVPLTGRVTGADLVPALAERAAERGYSIFLLGARDGVAARAAQILKSRYAGLKIAGVLSPPNMSILEMDRTILDEIKAAKPDILLVAFGNPKQEKWISMYAHELSVPICIGIGGTLDMIAGITKRAPLWMQRSGLEWLYRLAQEPRRLWKRYVLDLGYFGYFFVRQWWAMRRGRIPSTLLPLSDTIVVENTVILNIQGRMDSGNLAAFVDQATQALAVSPFLIVNLARAEFFDSSAMGALVALANRAREAGGGLRLVAVAPPVARILSLVRLDRFFDIDDDVETSLKSCRISSATWVAPEQDHHGWVVLKMPRSLDATTAPELIDSCTARMVENARLILDFSETTFVASAGLAAMVKLSRQSKEQGGELRVIGCSGDVLRGIKLVKLDLVIPLFQDLQSAIAPVATPAY